MGTVPSVPGFRPSPSATVFSDSFDFHLGAGDNGNIFKITNNRDSTHGRDQNFMYDSLNRIQQAYSSGTGTYSWGETFSPTATNPGIAPTTPGIDAWGNLMNRSGVTNRTYAELLDCPANANNQLTACTNAYDAAGNMTGYGAASYVYDAENRLIATAGYSYIYDGDGQRVEKCTEGTTPGTCASGATGTLYWRGLSSDPLSETNLAGTVQNTYVFFNGQRVARVDSAGAPHYYFSDHLGTHGVVENATGTVCEQDMDYYPYGGEEHDYCPNVAQNYKFTGKERDTESGLDNFGARYNLSTIGRFMTPDWAAKPTSVPYANFGDPQTLNLYAFVGDNPVNRVDPDGHRNDEWIKPYAKGAGFDVDGPGSADIAMVEAANTLLLLARASEAQNNSTQQPALVPLSKDVNYTVANNGPNAPEVHAVFSPETADHLNAAFKELNKDGITPQINSAFRTDSDQAYMQSGGSGTNPAAKVSWHQAGAAVDINGTRSPEFKTIISVMKKNGFVWGGDFKSHKDPPHFDGRQFMGNLNQAVRKAQSYWDSTQ
jgi:RHS repeat-associated protein